MTRARQVDEAIGRAEYAQPIVVPGYSKLLPPLETPTGRLLGVAHIQRLLREPPSTLVAGAIGDAYRALRTAEHRVQMVDDRQEHRLPLPSGRERLTGCPGAAAPAGFDDGGGRLLLLSATVPALRNAGRASGSHATR